MKTRKYLGDMLFWLTLISPMLSFSLSGEIGEVEIFGIGGLIRYSWVMLLFIPIAVLSFLIGLKLKSNNQKYKKNLIISFICLPLLLIFGSYRFIFSDNFSYDASNMSIIEEKINIAFPDEIKVVTSKTDIYDISYVKITDEESKTEFEQEIKTNNLWENTLNSAIKGLLPLDIQLEYLNCDFYIFYNVTNVEYNVYPQKGIFDCMFVSYDCNLQRLIIIDNYEINIY